MKLTVEEVIKKGVLNRNKNAMIILLIIPLIIICGIKGISILYFLIGFMLILTLYIVRHVITEQNWRIWALTNVDNPKEFKSIASEILLIPNNDKLFNKYEFHSSKYKQKWIELQKRFNENVENVPLLIPSTGLTFERNFTNLLFLNTFQLLRNKKNCELFIDSEKIIVNNENTFFWKDITKEEIILHFFDSNYKDTTVNILKFEHNNELVEIPLCFYKINEHFLIRLIESIRKSTDVISSKSASNFNALDLAILATK